MWRCFMKIILFTINLLFTLIGLGLIGLGIALATQMEKIMETLKESQIENIDLGASPYILISVGLVVFFIAFSGCFGSLTETKWLLVAFATCMGIFAAVKIAVSILLFVNLPTYTINVKTAVDNAFDNPNFNTTFHAFEALLKCCGTTGPDSYVNIYNLTAPTCCENPTPETICTKEEAFPIGCTTMIGDYFEAVVKLIGYILIGVLLYELVSMFFSIYIIKTIEPEPTKMLY